MIRKLLKILLKVLLILTVLVILIILLFHLPPVQKKLAGVAGKIINKQLNYPIEMGKLYVSLLNGIIIEDLLLIDEEKDTIIAVAEINAGIRYAALLQKELFIEEVTVEGILVRLVKEADSTLNIAGLVKESPEKPEPDTSKSPAFSIGIGALEISEVDFRYLDRVEKSQVSVSLKRLAMLFEKLDLEENQLLVESTTISGLQVEQIQSPAESPPSPESPVTLNPAAGDSVLFDIPWDIQFAGLVLEDIGVVLLEQPWVPGDEGPVTSDTKETRSGQQPFRISGLNARFSGLRLAGTQFMTHVDSFRASVAGYEIDLLEAVLLMDETHLSVDSLRVRSGGNELALEAGLTYPYFGMIQAAPGSVSVRLTMRVESPAGGLAPYLPPSLPVQEHPPIDISLRVAGTLNDPAVERMRIIAGDALKAWVHGRARNLLGDAGLSMEVYLDSAVVQTPELLAYLPDTLIPTSISLPKMITLQGSFSTNATATASEISLETSLGSLYAAGRLEGGGDRGPSSWTASLETPGLDLGSILGMQDTLGRIAFSADAEGITGGGGKPVIDGVLDINALEIMGYTYDSIALEAGTGQGNYFAYVRIVDENLDLRLTGTGRSLQTDPRIDLEIELTHATLDSLNLASEPTGIEMSGRVGIWTNLPVADQGSEPENTDGFLPKAFEGQAMLDILEGEVSLDGIRYRSGTNRLGVDSVRLSVDQVRDSLHGKLLVSGVTRNDTLVAERVSISARGNENHFRLNYLAKIAGSENNILAGPGIQGEGELILPGDSLVFNSSITVYDSKAIPDSSHYRLHFASLTPGEGSRELEALLKGERVGLSAQASLEQQGDKQLLDARVEIDSLDLGLIRPLATGVVDTIGGNITGSLIVSGSTDQPDLSGEFLFQQVYVKPAILNTGFLLEQEKVRFSNSRVLFDSVSITDQTGNSALLEGWIDLDSGAYPAMELSLKADQFRLMDQPAATGEMFYGTVVADLDADVTGSFSAPSVSLLVGFDHESSFSFIVPTGSIPSGEGVYVFESPEEPPYDPFSDTAVQEGLKAPETGRFELDTRVMVTKSLQLTIVTNPVTGEELKIRGEGDLSFGITEGGGMSLSGRYTVESGTYGLKLFDVIRREFSISEGSYLDWTGEIMEPDVQLTTVYRLRTSSRELLTGIRAGTGSEEESFGSIPVEVVMILTGDLLSPSLEFDIRTDERYSGTAIETALNQIRQNQSELNKQAFSLLVLGSFLSEGPVSRDPMAYELRNQARQSLSQLLTSQLNRFAGENLKGVDLEVGIESYEDTGDKDVEARTEVKLGLSKAFLNDRLTVEVGGSVALEETGQQEMDATGLGGDFAVEYLITPNGTYRIRAFNREESQKEFEGEVTVTGVSFIFRKDFSTLKDLFGGKKEEEDGK